jgi:hypothetical protein
VACGLAAFTSGLDETLALHSLGVAVLPRR